MDDGADFATSGSVRIEVDSSSLSSARDEIESTLGSVTVDVEPTSGPLRGFEDQLSSNIGPVPVEVEPQVSGGVTNINANGPTGGVAKGGNVISTTTGAGVGAGMGGSIQDPLETQTELLGEQNEYLEEINEEIGGGVGGGGLLSGSSRPDGGGGGGDDGVFPGVPNSVEALGGYKLLEKYGRGGMLSRLLKYGSGLTIATKTAFDFNEMRDDLEQGNRPVAGEEFGEALSTGAFGVAGWLAGGPAGGLIASMFGEPTYDTTAKILRNTWDPETTAADAASGSPNRSFPGIESMSPTNPSPVNAVSWMSGINAPSTSDMTPGGKVLNTSDIGGSTSARTDGVSMVGGYVPKEALSPAQRAQRTASKAQQTAESVQNMDVTVNLGGVNVQNKTDRQQVKEEVKRQVNSELDDQLDRILQQFLSTTGAGIVSKAQQSNFQNGF